ncbi:MAG: exodeoxyribonuclease VII large subunit [Oscillospiraceae bacterium]|jgi:exodeoxyribonuclease VII large subunit|nr:exodeoxyribonuclease VII large subunit [Oscillospiraceae bacterium]
MPQAPRVLSVAQLNTYVKLLLEEDDNLCNLFVTGEISNFKDHFSGHWYFTLKDAAASISAVMFKNANARLPFLPQNGMRVLVRGRVSVYDRDGKYQLYAEDMQPDGLGARYLAYEQLKERLAAEGLFAPERKQVIPMLPARVGIVTSGAGAALRDVLQILARRFPAAQPVLCPVQVQGAGAAQQIAAAVALFNERKAADVLIVGRGGGSLEDLWAFNEEVVARAVAASVIPVISAVGHETDTTICDFVADLRAPTPSAAAELAVPDARELAEYIQALRQRMLQALRRGLKQREEALEALRTRAVFRQPARLMQPAHLRLDATEQRIRSGAQDYLRERRGALARLCGQMEALSPLAVLARGYAIVRRGNALLYSVRALRPGDPLELRFFDGTAQVRVEREGEANAD